MTTHANGTFEVKTFDETTYDDIGGGRKLARARALLTFQGGIEGEGTVDYLMAYGEDGSAGIVGMLRIVGRLAGRSGSFVLQIEGDYHDGNVTLNWSVVPSAGTGDLQGLSGKGGVLPFAAMNAEWMLGYDFE